MSISNTRLRPFMLSPFGPAFAVHNRSGGFCEQAEPSLMGGRCRGRGRVTGAFTDKDKTLYASRLPHV